MSAAVVPSRDADEALWDKARAMLADELGVAPGAIVADSDRQYIEQHAAVYAAMLIAEDDELEAIYDTACADIEKALARAGEFHGHLANVRGLVAALAPVVVHAVLEARL